MVSRPSRCGALALVACALAFAGCGNGGNAGQFTINFVLNTSTGGCTSENCADFGMNCGAVLSVRIVEADSGAVVGRACETVAANANLCTLGNLTDAPTEASIFFDLPPEMLRIEIAAWSQTTLDADPTLQGDCPDADIFDLTGVPLTTFQPQPAFAGASYFDASSSANVATVSLACTEPGQLNTIECAPSQFTLSADVFNTERLRPVTGAQADLLVRVAEPREIQVEGQAAHEIDGTTSINLFRLGMTEVFSTEIAEDSLGPQQCTLVLEQTPQATTVAICETLEPNAMTPRTAALLEKQTFDQILAAVGLAAFPERGLVIGRVYDEASGMPLAGISMTPNVADPDVKYLNSARDATIGVQTSDNGYFIAEDVAFGTTWDVVDPSGLVPSRPLVGGLVRNHLTILLVPMVVDPKIGQ